MDASASAAAVANDADGDTATTNGYDDIPARVSKLLQQAKTLQNAGSALSSRLRVEEQSLSQRAISLEKDIKRIRAQVLSALETGEIVPQLAEKVCWIPPDISVPSGLRFVSFPPSRLSNSWICWCSVLPARL
jgi:hypothetical protein